jgi:hypothetical protein
VGFVNFATTNPTTHAALEISNGATVTAAQILRIAGVWPFFRDLGGVLEIFCWFPRFEFGRPEGWQMLN